MIGDLEHDAARSAADPVDESDTGDSEGLLLTTERLRQVLDYDWETGVFRWLVRMGQRGRIGAITGRKETRGYLQISIDGHLYMAHRLAWKWIYGRWPIADIDHINSNRDDNRLANLREATRSQNMANIPRQKNNKSGFKGVSWHAKTGKWVAQIKMDKRKVHLGLFTDPAEAHAAYSAAAKRHHGEFARLA